LQCTYSPIHTIVNFLRESREKPKKIKTKTGNSNIEYRPTKKNHSELNRSVNGSSVNENLKDLKANMILVV